MSYHDMKNPTGGVHMRHVIKASDPNIDFQIINFTALSVVDV